ncbi:MAG: aspartate aminotransferase family protein [Arenicellales bacterium]|nr:aspartate aminotransferase family protein [Arenicellales bacterium]
MTDQKKLDIDTALGIAVAHYRQKTPKSRAHYDQACDAMPGGNTRTVLHYDPYPVTISKGAGCIVWDLDGNQYTDFLGEYSAGLYGHSNPAIAEAVVGALDQGIVLCAPNRYETELAGLLCKRFPSCERLRFCNSGTEANLMAVSAAKVYTGRNKIVVFDGAYHGGVFYFAGHHSPANAPFEFLIGEFNNVEKSAAMIQNHGADIAAILIEPMQGAGGCIPGEPEFLRTLRESADRHGIVLIFDEVMTSRLAPGGLQEKLNLTPDMTTFGKYLGGGLSFGAFGGRQDIMDLFDPRRVDALPHAGTFNNNVLTMAAGLAGLRDIYTPERAISHNRLGDEFRNNLNRVIAEHDVPMTVSGIGSLMCIHFQSETPRCTNDSVKVDPRLSTLFHLEMLLAGLYIADRGYMSLSLALEKEDYETFVSGFDHLLSRHGGLVRESQ